VTGHPPPLHPLLLLETPVWPQPPEDDDLAGITGIVLTCVLGTALWVAGIGIWLLLLWLG
jgi:hypothetical protein